VNGIVFNSVASWFWLNNKLLWVVLYILSPALAFSGGFLYWRRRQYAAQASAESIITDAKPHLLYLRPFRSAGLRLGLDAGAVFEVRDPILKSAAFTGTHINRTARLEPNTPPRKVYVTLCSLRWSNTAI
jgi:hypothetical protein